VIYVPADGIHTYLSGDIVECMARSKNVLNMGFCPRADRGDVDLFTEALTFEQNALEKVMLNRVRSKKRKTGKTSAFKPPMGEFNMLITELKSVEKEVVREIEGPSVRIVVSGSGKIRAGSKEYDLKMGWIFFVGQGVEVEYVAEGDGKEVLVLYAAYAEGTKRKNQVSIQIETSQDSFCEARRVDRLLMRER
jgi:mannose-6-phosphate isomerase